MTHKNARLDQLDAHWRAANYLGAAQLYLRENPLLRDPLRPADIKPRLLGHWGTQPGLNLVYAHLNRLIQDTGDSVLLVVGPGHGAPGILADLYLEGTLGEVYPELTFDLEGLRRLTRRFSWPDGFPSHLFPGTPGMIHEGGELGYGLSHAFGAAFDNPDLLVACVVGDGEAETGPLAAAWHGPKFLNPRTSGAVLPILHLNGYKLSGPTLMGRMTDRELEAYFSGLGWRMILVSGDDPYTVHRELWAAMDRAHAEIRTVQENARTGPLPVSPTWPMIVLRTPKGWTGPRMLDGKAVEGTFHAHQIPIPDPAHNPDHLRALEEWLRSYRPEELFEADGNPAEKTVAICPRGEKRIGRNPHGNGGRFLEPLPLPDYTEYGAVVPAPGAVEAEATRELGKWVRDLFHADADGRRFRFFCPDETTSNRMDAIFDATGRAWMGPVVETDEFLDPDGRVMEILSEHTCEGWLEGYLLTGRHGLFACYEAFIPIIDSMLNQYAKWLKVSREVPWREPISSLNFLLTSHVWRQDHNGYSHQVPSFIDNVANKKSSVARVYLPPDANCLLSVTDHCLRSRDYVNLIVASKQKSPQWLDMDAAREHCARGISRWSWASNDEKGVDVVMAAAGDVPTKEIMAAVQILREEMPELRMRVVNVVDLFTIMSRRDHPHGLDDGPFEELFPTGVPVIFAFHGYPRVIHELLHHRTEPHRFHVHGYREEGRTTTPMNMLVLNGMSRWDLAISALTRVERFRSQSEIVEDRLRRKIREHETYIIEHDEDLPEVTHWRWGGAEYATSGKGSTVGAEGGRRPERDLIEEKVK